MKDHYKRLGIPMNTGEERIRSILPFLRDEQFRHDCERVLLDPESREVYDRNLKLLRKIAFARRELGLDKTVNWSPEMQKEFSDPSTKPSTKPDVVKSSSVAFTFGILGIIAVVFLLLFLLGVFETESSRFKIALRQDTIHSYKSFLENYPHGTHEADALLRIRELELLSEWRMSESQVGSVDARLTRMALT